MPVIEPTTSPFDLSMQRATLRSALKGARTLSVVMAVGFVLLSLAVAAGGRGDQVLRIAPAVAALVLYELWVCRYLGRVLAADSRPPGWWPYVNVTVEVTGCTGLVLVAVHVTDPLLALLGPPTISYIAIVLLSTLALDVRLCFFAGLVAAIEYWVLAATYFGEVERLFPIGSELVEAPTFVIQGMMLALLGVVMGLIAREVRTRTSDAIQEASDRMHVLDLFGQQVSPEVVDRLLQQANPFDSENRFVCVMFLDIRNFTSFSESRTPEEVVDYLNTLFDNLIDTVNAHQGIINKFLGDGFMAVFGAPTSSGQESRSAVRAALDALARVDDLVASGRIPETRIGIGLNAGQVVTGNVGSRKRREYTVIGDVVNTASRIEALNKSLGSQLLVSDEVWQAVAEDFVAEPVEPMAIKGKAEPVQVWRIDPARSSGGPPRDR